MARGSMKHARGVGRTALWLLALGAAAGIATAGPARAALGSSEQPILLPGVETSALRPGHLPPDHLEFRADGITGSLNGIMAGTRTAGSRIGLAKTAPWGQETNFIAGAGVTVSPMFFLESGRVTLRDPIDVATSGNAGPEYWATSAGFQISF
jgi:hypothetical protein